MVNKCCLIYCKSEANGFSFPCAEKYPDLRKKWIQFVSENNFEPSSHSRICIHHFEERFIKFGKRNHLKWELSPVPTIHTNDLNDKTGPPSSLPVPKIPRPAPRNESCLSYNEGLAFLPLHLTYHNGTYITTFTGHKKL